MGQKTTEHPALRLLRHEAAGFLVKFESDLSKHDAAQLNARPAGDAFAWVVWSEGTHLAFAAAVRPRDQGVGALCVECMPSHCAGPRFYFWDGAVLCSYASAAALDERMAAHERKLCAAIDERWRGGRHAV